MKIVIIGSGSAAFAAAIYAAERGTQVTMVEQNTIGGTCVNVGCVPSKVMIQAAHVAHSHIHSFKGIEITKPKIERRLLVKQQEALVSQLRKEKYESILDHYPNITLIKGFARFRDEKTVEVRVSGKQESMIEADRILVVTGSSPHVPDIDGLKETPFWTSTEALQSEELPKHLIVLGASYVAIELAQSFLRLGSKVTLLARSTILSREDPQIGAGLEKVFIEEGMRVITHTVPKSIHFDGNEFEVDIGNEIIRGDRLLVATGRNANTEHLALSKAGVRTNLHGQIIVDEYMRTNVDSIYAAGDCTQQPQYVYVAAAAGTRAAVNILGGKSKIDLSVVPAVVFTDPQVATVGLSEADAIERKFSVDSRTLALDNVPRALANFDTRGFVKLVADKSNGRLLGCQILASGAGDIIQIAALAIHNNMTVNQIATQMFPYLTMAESIKLCAQIFTKDVKKLSCCADAIILDDSRDADKVILHGSQEQSEPEKKCCAGKPSKL
jgi:mercuric reductase